jgi:hypothetical protein
MFINPIDLDVQPAVKEPAFRPLSMLLAAGVLTLGFLARELIIRWHTLGLRRVPDHYTIIFTWW